MVGCGLLWIVWIVLNRWVKLLLMVRVVMFNWLSNLLLSFFFFWCVCVGESGVLSFLDKLLIFLFLFVSSFLLDCFFCVNLVILDCRVCFFWWCFVDSFLMIFKVLLWFWILIILFLIIVVKFFWGSWWSWCKFLVVIFIVFIDFRVWVLNMFKFFSCLLMVDFELL